MRSSSFCFIYYLITFGGLLWDAAMSFSVTSPNHGKSTQGLLAVSSSVENPAVDSGDDRNVQDDPNSKYFNETLSVLICPAQFCVPADYQTLVENLPKELASKKNIAQVKVAPLPRTEWIQVARQLPTQKFFQAQLDNHVTLEWYFRAMDVALQEMFAACPETNICIIGHSIGGWVARAYLGGLSRSSTAVTQLAQERCTSIITLGTPHVVASTALVDQTRGLIREIDETPSCSAQALADKGIDITCVCSSSVKGSFLSINLEEWIAASSYLPLLGIVGLQTKGDGIVPLELAFMDPPARQVILEQCPQSRAPIRHSHVLPTPWNLWKGYDPSIPLEYESYVSPSILPEWIDYIR